MARRRIFARSGKERVYEKLLAHITGSNVPVNGRLASLGTLASRFGTSPGTVYAAMNELEKSGIVTKRHGSGTYVNVKHRGLSMADAVMLCFETRAHVFGDLAAMLAEQIQSRRHVVTIVDSSRLTADGAELMDRIRCTETPYFVVHTHAYFPYELFRHPAFLKKHVVALDKWTSNIDWPGLYRVLSRYNEGGEHVARHLWERGHRHALLMGTRSLDHYLRAVPAPEENAGRAFADEWTRLGGTWESAFADNAPDALMGMELEGPAFRATFSKARRPTAIFGTMDAVALLAQQALRQWFTDLAPSVDIVGYGDTPWSRAASPALTTVSFDLPAMTAEAMRILDELWHGRTPASREIRVPQKLIVRESTGGGLKGAD